MAAVCPPPVPGITHGTSIHSFTLAVVILLPFIILVLFLFFYVNRNSSVYLRKRSVVLLALSCLGMFTFWSSTVLYDYLGADKYPCALYGFLVYAGCPFLGGPVFMKSLAYGSQVSVQTLNSNVGEVKPAARPANFFAHVRVIFCGSRTKSDRLMSAQFSLTPFFWIAWSLLTVSPYVIAYSIRLGTDPAWYQGCSGCHLSESDLITLLVINSINFLVAFFAYSFRLKRKDSLRIIRECLLGIGLPLSLLVLSYTFALIDPGDSFKNGRVDWVSFSLVPAFLSVYMQTVHQVLVARSIKRKILFSENFDRADKFDDVMNDKDLKTALRRYMNSELSGEIILFLEACNEAKALYAQDPALGEAELRVIYRMFVEKNRAVYEINLPFNLRENVERKMKSEVIDLSVFDEAYDDVKRNLLRDGFPRFLNYLKANPHKLKVTGLASRLETKMTSKVPEQMDV